MKQKRFMKLLMGHGMSHRTAKFIIEAQKHAFHQMEKHNCFVIDEESYCSSFFWVDRDKPRKIEFKEFKALSYSENYKLLQEGRLMYVYDFPFARPVVGWNGFKPKKGVETEGREFLV